MTHPLGFPACCYPFGYIYTTGTFNDTNDFDPTGNMFNMTSATPFEDPFVQRLQVFCQNKKPAFAGFSALLVISGDKISNSDFEELKLVAALKKLVRADFGLYKPIVDVSLVLPLAI